MEPILIGTTDRTVLVFIPDPASTTGAGKTGLNAAAMTVTYTRVETDNDVVHADVTSSLNDLSALTDSHNDWGWKEVSSTLSKGLYRLDVADAVFASGAWYAVIQITITSGTAPATPVGFRLVAYNELDAVRMGLTSLPNAAAEAFGGLITWGSGAGQLYVVDGIANANIIQVYDSATAAEGASLVFDYYMGNSSTLPPVASVVGAVGSVTGNVGGIAGTITTLDALNTGLNSAHGAGSWATATGFSTHSATDVWAVATRTLTANTNLNILTAADIRTAIGMASANLDMQLGTILADTNELQTDWVNGGRLDTILDASAASASTAATNAINANTNTSTIITNLQTVDDNVDAIKLVTVKLDSMLVNSSGWRFSSFALALAPTDFTIDSDDINSIVSGVVSGLQGATLTYSGPITPSGDAEIYQGSSYISGELHWDGTWTGPDIDGASATAYFVNIETYNIKGLAAESVLEVDAEIELDGTDLTVTIPQLTSAQTTALLGSPCSEVTHKIIVFAEIEASSGEEKVAAFRCDLTVHRTAESEE